jgi:hypothetical protein
MKLIEDIKSIINEIHYINSKIEIINNKVGYLESKTNEYDNTYGRIETIANNIETKIDKYDRISRMALGRIENRQIGNNGIEFKIYSQWGEDGIIQHIINNISISNTVFVEFGVENYTESNTRFLLKNNNWSGLVIDGSKDNTEYIKRDPIYWEHNLKVENAFITKDNINDLIYNQGINGKIGLLSIDIDGNDYWVWNEIKVVDPDVVICEYNPRFGKEKSVTIPYKADFVRTEAHYSGIYFGASIQALNKLANEKGYNLVYGNEANLFFVKKELCNDIIKEVSVDEAYVKNQYQDSRDENGLLNRISYELENNIISSLPLVEV